MPTVPPGSRSSDAAQGIKPHARSLMVKGAKRSSGKEVKREITDSESGDVVADKKAKKSPGTKRASVFSVYQNWRGLLSRHISFDLISERAAGSDIGHIKNLLSFFGGEAKVFELIELFVTRWNDIKKKFPIARNKDVPTLYLVDTLKHDLLAVMCGKSSLVGEEGGAHRADGQSAMIGRSREEIEAYFKGGTKWY